MSGMVTLSSPARNLCVPTGSWVTHAPGVVRPWGPVAPTHCWRSRRHHLLLRSPQTAEHVVLTPRSAVGGRGARQLGRQSLSLSPAHPLNGCRLNTRQAIRHVEVPRAPALWMTTSAWRKTDILNVEWGKSHAWLVGRVHARTSRGSSSSSSSSMQAADCPADSIRQWVAYRHHDTADTSSGQG